MKNEDLIEKHMRLYREYDTLFNDSYLRSLPDVGSLEESIHIMEECIKHGKDAVDMGFAKERRGYLKCWNDDGSIDTFDA